MLHFSGMNGYSKRPDIVNQPKSYSNLLLLQIEEELHDARRVQSYGQEEDLRAALNIVINRVVELSSLLNEAYKAQAELEVQLNVAKSNLQLVISNNEMLEEALKRETKGNAQEVGWHRRSGREASVSSTTSRRSDDRRGSLDSTSGIQENNSGISSAPPTVPPAAPVPAPSPSSIPSSQDSRFFRFRFTGSSSAPSRPSTRPSTPSGVKGANASTASAHHLTSSSMPALPLTASREIEELSSELEKERTARKTISDQKAALEAELESLSQALFEEANKMVATERMKRAEAEEELKETKLEQEALRSALRLLEGENCHLREGTQTSPESVSSSILDQGLDKVSTTDLDESLLATRVRQRSSSQIALKSPITSPRSSMSSPPPQAAQVPTDAESASQPKTPKCATSSSDTDPPFDDPSTTPVGKSFNALTLDNTTDPTPYDTPPSSSHLYGDMGSSPWEDMPPRTSRSSDVAPPA